MGLQEPGFQRKETPMSSAKWTGDASFNQETQKWDLVLGGVKVPPERIISLTIRTAPQQVAQDRVMQTTVLAVELALSGEVSAPPPGDEPPMAGRKG